MIHPVTEFRDISPNASATKRILHWVDGRFPVSKFIHQHLTHYFVPANLNIWYVFGSLAIVVLIIQMMTGVVLAMHYKPDATLAFASVESMMRDVSWGWLIRYMHSTGASAFFVVMYLHIFRGLIYGSYRKPRELVWLLGCLIYFSLMASAFTGYLLPWGQMSYWGAQVIINLLSAIPLIGPDIALLVRGDFVVGDATLNRFFGFHIIVVPLVLLGLVLVHLVALHTVGSNNPDGMEFQATTSGKDISVQGIPFYPYHVIHDSFAVSVFLLIFFAIVFFSPEMGGLFLEYNNWIPADSMQTPLHIAPVWYFTPFYTLLRTVTIETMQAVSVVVASGVLWAVFRVKMPFVFKSMMIFGASWFVILMYVMDAKFWGIMVMMGSVAIWMGLPWLDRSPVGSVRYRPFWHQCLYAIFTINFLVMGYLGTQPVSVVSSIISRLGTLFYFGFFILMPWWSCLGTARPAPPSIVDTAH